MNVIREHNIAKRMLMLTLRVRGRRTDAKDRGGEIQRLSTDFHSLFGDAQCVHFISNSVNHGRKFNLTLSSLCIQIYMFVVHLFGLNQTKSRKRLM